MLRVENLSAAYGAVQVLWDVNLDIRDGEIVALIGSNGAGKSTLLSVVSGLLKARAGKVRFDERDITHAASSQIVEAGLVHVPQGRRLFAGLSVKENLLMGAYRRSDRGQVLTDLEWVLSLFPSLERRLALPAGKMSGG
ncbi:MAG: ATP-binding cassette domain-containing protein, partial [Chloroflexi bacterium]